MNLEILRLVTIHPILVHVTVGAIPIVVVLYGVAAHRRSERWSFAGDATLALATAATVGTFAFGLVSNWVLTWPGGLGGWRWLHLAMGSTSLLLMLAMTAFRVQRPNCASWRTCGFAAAVAVVIGFTGWIGGDVLVYHAGMAVMGAAEGALAPPIDGADGTPKDLGEVMDRIRPSWAAIATNLDRMVIERPSPDGFAEVGTAAARIALLASSIAGRAQGEPIQTSLPPDTPVVRPPPPLPFDVEPEIREHMAHLEEHARRLSHAAAQGDLAKALDAAAKVRSTCAECHREHRWRQQ